MPPEPPSNAPYLIAAYLVATIILLGYAVSLWRRAQKAVNSKR
jgi:hypothetical protein